MTDDLNRRIDDAVTPPSAIHIDLDSVIAGERRRRRKLGAFGGVAAVAVVAVGALVGSTFIAPTPPPPPGIAAEQKMELPSEPPIDIPDGDFMWDRWGEEIPSAVEYNDAFWSIIDERWSEATIDRRDPTMEGHPETLKGTPSIVGRSEVLSQFDGVEEKIYNRLTLSLVSKYEAEDGLSWGEGPLQLLFGRDLQDQIAVNVLAPGDFTIGDGSYFDAAFCDVDGQDGFPTTCTFEEALTDSGLTYVAQSGESYSAEIDNTIAKFVRVVLLRSDGSAVVVSDRISGKPGAEDLVPDEDVADDSPSLTAEDLLAIAEAMPMTPIS